jgi:ribosomal protein S10
MKMKHYHLIITSKTKKSIQDFLTLLNDNSINSTVIKKHFTYKKKKKILTILKSPHVNKTAQEQFQLSFFYNQVTVYSNNIFQSLIFLKKIKNNLFSDLKIKIKFFISKSLFNKTQTKILTPNNFKLNTLNKFLIQKNRTKKLEKKNYKQVIHLLKIFDLYGELVQK